MGYEKGFRIIIMALFLCMLLPVQVLAADSDNSAGTGITSSTVKEQKELEKKAEKERKQLEKAEKERAEIDELSQKALERLYEKVPSTKRVIGKSYAYATLSNTGMKLGLFGSAHGRGVAINNETGERVYMRMSEAGVGIGLGIKEYDLVFVIANEEAWNSFTKDDWKIGGSAEAAANVGDDGDSLEGATIIRDGVWVYQLTKKGLSLEASIKGTNIYPDKKLNAKPTKTE